MNENKEREAFEAWRNDCGYSTEPYASVLWLAWRARAALSTAAHGVGGMSDEAITEAVLKSKVLRYKFALNGGAGPVSEKGMRIFREIEGAILNAAPAPVAAPASEPVALPERVIDVLWQQAGLTSFHPDGDQLAKFHMFANLVTIELWARLPATPPAAGADDARDAARWRAYRNGMSNDERRDAFVEKLNEVLFPDGARFPGPSADEWDTAIDAALRAGNQGEAK